MKNEKKGAELSSVFTNLGRQTKVHVIFLCQHHFLKLIHQMTRAPKSYSSASTSVLVAYFFNTTNLFTPCDIINNIS